MNKIVLSEEQSVFVQGKITSVLETYGNNPDVTGIYLSTYYDGDNVPTVELTLVTNWFQNGFFAKGKSIMGFYDCPRSNSLDSQPIYVLSMADVKRYNQCIADGSINAEDRVMQDELKRCDKVLLDKDGILEKFISLTPGKTYSIGTGKERFERPIAIIDNN